MGVLSMLTKPPKDLPKMFNLLPCGRRMHFIGKVCRLWVPVFLLTHQLLCCSCSACQWLPVVNQQPTRLATSTPPHGAPERSQTPQSQADLVEYLVSRGAVKSTRVQGAMRAVDRKLFVNPHWIERYAPLAGPYQDRPLPICEDQTISAPHMHGTCLDLLADYLYPGARALDVGSGSGYLTACMALLVGESGYVIGIDKVRELTVRSIDSIKASNLQLKSMGGTQASGQTSPPSSPSALKHCTLIGSGPNWTIYHGNVLTDALEGQPQFAAIHVGAAADTVPRELVAALQPGGRMVIPVGPYGLGRVGGQELTVVDKDKAGHVSLRKVMGVIYVPLTHPSED